MVFTWCLQKFFNNLTKNQNFKSYPLLFLLENDLYIDVVYFALIYSKSFKESSKNNFLNNFFQNKNAPLLDQEYSEKIFKEINRISFASIGSNLIKVNGEKKSFVSKTKFFFDDNIYSSNSISCSIDDIKSFNILVDFMQRVQPTIEKPKINISKDIFGHIVA